MEVKIDRYQPGEDFFTENFYSLFFLFIFTVLFWGSLTANQEDIDLNHFSKNQVLILMGLLFLMVLERMMYRVRGDSFLGRNRIAIKLCLFLGIVVFVHYAFTVTFPSMGLWMSQSGGAKVYYILWLVYFYFSGR